MCYIISFIILFCVCTFDDSFCQNYKLIGPPGGSVITLFIHPSNSDYILVGNSGSGLYKSTDGGSTFSIIENQYNFKDIKASKNHPDIIFASAKYNYLKSTDGGNSWNKINHNGENNILTVFNPLNDNVVYQIRDENKLWRSDDLGESWYLWKNFEGDISDFIICNTDTSVMYSVVSNVLLKSTDTGNTWLSKYDFGWRVKVKVHPSDHNTVYADSRGVFYRSKNGGDTFEVLLNVRPALLGGFSLSPKDTMTIYIGKGAYLDTDMTPVLKTTDGGNIWSELNINVFGKNENVFAAVIELNPNDENIIYIGSGMGLFKSTDSGVSWSLQKFPMYSPLDLYVLVEEPGLFICQHQGWGWGTISTYDYGNSWHPAQVTGYDYRARADIISFSPNDRAFGLYGSKCGIFKTTNKGKEWVNTEKLAVTYSIAYHPKYPEIILAGGKYDPSSKQFVQRSTDGGNTWKFLNNIAAGNFVFDPFDSNIVYATAGAGIIKSTNFGLNWFEINIGLNNGYIYRQISIDEKTQNTLYAVGEPFYVHRGGIYKSINGGESWFRVDALLQFQDPVIAASSILLDRNKHGRFFIGLRSYNYSNGAIFSNGGLFLTEDDGITWVKIYDGSVEYIRADTSTPRNIYFVTKLGIMHLVDTILTTNVEHQDNTIGTLNLKQNYPNPFNAVTKINYKISNSMHVKLKIFDILGREITTLVDQEQSSGSYTINFDAKNLSSGIFLYQLKAGNLTQTKKMILLR